MLRFTCRYMRVGAECRAQAGPCCSFMSPKTQHTRLAMCSVLTPSQARQIGATIGLAPHQCAGLVGEAPRLDQAEHVAQMHPLAPHQQGAVSRREIVHRQRGELVEGSGRIAGRPALALVASRLESPRRIAENAGVVPPQHRGERSLGHGNRAGPKARFRYLSPCFIASASPIRVATVST